MASNLFTYQHVLRILKYGLLICCMVPMYSFQNVANVNTNARVKAVFMYNFSKYIEWPAEYKKGNFVIGIVGDTPLYKELANMARTKKAGNQSFEIKKYSSVSQLEDCHIVFIPYKKSSLLSGVLKKTKNKSTVIVTESKGLAQKGAGINFVVKDYKQKFELNRKELQKRSLKVSYKLESLAILVE